jgi:hypothetical protein
MARKTPTVLVFIAILHLVALLPVTRAQQQKEWESTRYEITPFFGYRSGITFPINPSVSGTNPRVVVNASPTYGISFGVRLRREEDMIEVRWARQDSYLQTEEITPPLPRQRMLLDQFHGDFSHEPFIEDWPSWVRPYIIASVGATHISSSTEISFTRFSFGIGCGLRLYPTRHVGFKIQAEWVPIFADPNIAVVCGNGCLVHVGGTAVSQGEVFAGPILRF